MLDVRKFLLFFLSALAVHGAFAQQQLGPVTTPQINSTLFVGDPSGFYPTIQSAVIYGCTLTAAKVDIPAQFPTTSGDITALTGGCSKVSITDERVSPSNCYSWSGSAYVGCAATNGYVGISPNTSQTVTQPAGTALNIAGVLQNNGNATLTTATGINRNPTASQNVTNPAGTYTGLNAPTLVNNFLTTNANGSQTLYAWGNSQTAGYNLSDCTNLTCESIYAWPSVFAQTMGWTVNNQAVSSSDCADLSFQGHSLSLWDLHIDTESRNVYAHFRNDQSQYGPLPYRVDFGRGCIEAQTAWLAIPESGKTRAYGNTNRTGTWTDGFPNSAASETATAGATMTFYVTGKTVYIATARIANNATTQYTVAVDGKLVYDPTTKSTTFAQDLDVGVVPGLPVSEQFIQNLIRVPGLPNGLHQIVYTCVTPSTSDCMVFFAAGVNPDNSTANGPFVYSLSPIYNAPAEQTGYMSSGTTSIYYDEWRRIISELDGDGLQVIGLDATNPNVYNSGTQSQADGIHPTQAGHASIAAAMVSKATGAVTPSDRTESKVNNAGPAYGGFGAGPAPSPSGAGSTNATYRIPPGILWTSNDWDTGELFMGFDGTSWIGRLPDDPTGSEGYGTGHIFALQSADGQNDNWVIPGQMTPYTLKVNTSVAQGGALKHQRFALNPTTSATVGNYADTPITWTAAFSDVNYTVNCMLEASGSNQNAQAALAIYGKTAAGFTIRMTNTYGVINSGIGDCWAGHD